MKRERQAVSCGGKRMRPQYIFERKNMLCRMGDGRNARADYFIKRPDDFLKSIDGKKCDTNHFFAAVAKTIKEELDAVLPIAIKANEQTAQRRGLKLPY